MRSSRPTIRGTRGLHWTQAGLRGAKPDRTLRPHLDKSRGPSAEAVSLSPEKRSGTKKAKIRPQEKEGSRRGGGGAADGVNESASPGLLSATNGYVTVSCVGPVLRVRNEGFLSAAAPRCAAYDHMRMGPRRTQMLVAGGVRVYGLTSW